MNSQATQLNRPPRAIALMSGGLDSTLAAKLIKDQGVEVIGLHLVSPFGCQAEVEKTCVQIGIPVLFKDKGEAYLDMVESPTYGYGKAMNPCIDCRIYMFHMAEKILREQDADFVVTGEVIGQRPMSQQKGAMDLIDKKSPLFRRVLRPLCAQSMEPTLAEENGWVDREKLLDIWGRGRKTQLALAEELGIKFFSAPSGGCLLTEVSFGHRLKDLIEHKTYQSSEERLAQSKLLRFGRHFRLSDKTKVIIGRNEQENIEMEKLWSEAGGIFFKPHNFDGASGIAFGEMTAEQESLISSMVARYGKSKDLASKELMLTDKTAARIITAQQNVSEEELERMRL